MMTKRQLIATIENHLKTIEDCLDFGDTTAREVADTLTTKVKVYLDVLEDEDIPYDMAIWMKIVGLLNNKEIL